MPNVVWPLILIIVGLAILAIVLAVLLWALGRLRKSLKDPPAFQLDTGWTIEQISELHKSGQLTDNQYRDLRQVVMAGLQKKANTGASDNSRPII